MAGPPAHLSCPRTVNFLPSSISPKRLSTSLHFTTANLPRKASIEDATRMPPGARQRRPSLPQEWQHWAIYPKKGEWVTYGKERQLACPEQGLGGGETFAKIVLHPNQKAFYREFSRVFALVIRYRNTQFQHSPAPRPSLSRPENRDVILRYLPHDKSCSCPRVGPQNQFLWA